MTYKRNDYRRELKKLDLEQSKRMREKYLNYLLDASIYDMTDYVVKYNKRVSYLDRQISKLENA